MRAGLLDKTIVIERVSTTLSAAGVPVETWTPLVTLRAQLVQASTEEFIRQFGASTETAIIFRTYFYDGITLADRVSYAGKYHDIKELTELGRRQGLEIRTQAIGP